MCRIAFVVADHAVYRQYTILGKCGLHDRTGCRNALLFFQHGTAYFADASRCSAVFVAGRCSSGDFFRRVRQNRICFDFAVHQKALKFCCAIRPDGEQRFCQHQRLCRGDADTQQTGFRFITAGIQTIFSEKHLWCIVPRYPITEIHGCYRLLFAERHRIVSRLRGICRRADCQRREYRGCYTFHLHTHHFQLPSTSPSRMTWNEAVF